MKPRRWRASSRREAKPWTSAQYSAAPPETVFRRVRRLRQFPADRVLPRRVDAAGSPISCDFRLLRSSSEVGDIPTVIRQIVIRQTAIRAEADIRMTDIRQPDIQMTGFPTPAILRGGALTTTSA